MRNQYLTLSTKPLFGAIILAAGQSKRFGSNKLVAKIGGEPLIKRTIAPFQALPCDVLVVVTGAYAEELKEVLSPLGVRTTHNLKFASSGMAISVKCGLDALGSSLPQLDGLFLHPGDIPLINLDDLEAMVSALLTGESDVLIPTHRGRKGHPLLVGKSAIVGLANISDERLGLRGFLDDYQDRLGYVDLPNEGVLRDVDYRNDLGQLAV